MATLRSSEGQEHPVPARLLLGRSPACGLRLSEVHASSEHATLSWNGWQWELKDLGSRNGTWVDGGRLEPGAPVKLATGAKLAFGDPAKTWELSNDDPPGLTAVNQNTGAVRVARDGLLVLPNDEAPEATFYLGAAGAWVLEDAEGNQRELRDQEVVSVGDDWQIQLPQVAEGTPLMQLVLSLDTASLVFAVSRNEERVEMTISHRGAEIPLEPREHGYVLLTLARARLEDAHLPPEQRGWRERDRLERMLAMDSNALNVAIHRARQQLSTAGVSGAANIVEVKRKARRLGTDRFRIVALPDP